MLRPTQEHGAEKLVNVVLQKSLAEIAEIVSGFGFPKHLQGKTEGELPFFKVGDISRVWNRGEKLLTHAEHYLARKEAEQIKAKVFPKGTVVFAKIGEAIKLNRRAILGQPSIVDNNVMGLIPRQGLVDTLYLYYHMLTVKLGDISQATTVPSVRKSDVESIAFPLVPIEAQTRIVAEIEKQFSRLDEAVANLKRVKANLKRYKASVLKAAVEGKLTEDWRLSARAASRKRAQASELETIPKAGNDKWFIYIIECDDGSYYVGHTADLHDRWQRHCEGSGADWTRQHPPKYLVHFEECGSIEAAVKRENDLKTGFGRTWRKREIDGGRMKPLVHNPANETAQPVHGEDMQTGSKLLERILTERRVKWNSRGKCKETPVPDTANLPPLPNTWTWSSVETICSDVVDCPHSTPKWEATGRVCLRTTEFRPGRLVLADVRFVSQSTYEKRIQRLKPRENDVVYSREGGILGVACMVPHGIDPCLGQRMMLLRSHVLFTPNLLMHWLNSSWTLARVRSLTGGSASPHLNVGEVKQFPVPVAPLAEQEQIVAEVERRLSVIDELEAAVEANLTRADRLRQSILSQAFNGKLLSNGASG